MEFTDRAIVLRLGGFREADLWVRLLSPTRGIFSAFAFGGSKSRRRFSGCLDLFNEVHFHVKTSGQSGYLALQEGTLLRGPDKLRHDWRKLGVAVNCSLFLESFCLDNMAGMGGISGLGSMGETNASQSLNTYASGMSSFAPSMTTETDAAVRIASGPARTHDLFVQLLNVLESDVPVSPLLPIFFRARLACEQGYALSARGCSSCGQSWESDCKAGSQAILLLGEHGLICPDCAARLNSAARRFHFGADSLLTLRHILEQPLDNWHNLPAAEQGQKECARALDAFLQFHTGLHWSNGRFKR